LNRLRTTNIPQALRWSILAWVLVFSCSQSIASTHIHVDSHSDTVCVLCIHADNTPTLDVNGFVNILAASGCRAFSAITDQWIQLDPPSAYFTRAPPQA